MCGINGFNFVSPQLIQTMNEKLAHRGPDYSGTYVDEQVSLGHTLLSIRGEPERSQQPFKKEESSPWVLLFNGQIYNVDQIKSRFLDPSFQDEKLDTAILFQLIEKRGWDFIDHIHGMFAVALYHRKENQIRLYRDPTGQKALYYYWKGAEFIFSSEIKGILAHPTVSAETDFKGVTIAASLGYIPDSKTLLKSISKVNVSECVTLDLKPKKICKSFYSSIASQYYSDMETSDEDGVFESLIQEHLQTKRRLALNLSGGLDSSLLLHEMSQLGTKAFSYTTLFDVEQESFNEDAVVARMLSKLYQTEHHEIRITTDQYREHFVEAYRIIEEPNYNISLPIYLLTAKTEGILKRPQFSWTLIRGESNIQGGGGNGSIEERAGEGVGGDGGSPEGDRSARRRHGR